MSPGHVASETWGRAEELGTLGRAAVQLHEGHRWEAAKTLLTGAVATHVLKEIPEAAPLAVMAATIDASKDPKIEKDAFAAGGWVEGRTSSPVAGGVAAAAVATGESLFNATFGTVGKDIGEGAAALYLEAREIILKP